MTPQERLDASWSAFEASGDAIAATWTPATGSPVDSTVIQALPGELVLTGIVTTNRAVRYRTAYWPTVRAGDTVTIGATTYRVEAPMPMDDGLVATLGLKTQ